MTSKKKVQCARDGVIIEWPLNGQFHEPRDLIITFWSDIFGVGNDNNDDVQMLGNIFYRE